MIVAPSTMSEKFGNLGPQMLNQVLDILGLTFASPMGLDGVSSLGTTLRSDVKLRECRLGQTVNATN
jgi:hypothetical protein